MMLPLKIIFFEKGKEKSILLKDSLKKNSKDDFYKKERIKITSVFDFSEIKDIINGKRRKIVFINLESYKINQIEKLVKKTNDIISDAEIIFLRDSNSEKKSDFKVLMC